LVFRKPWAYKKSFFTAVQFFPRFSVPAVRSLTRFKEKYRYFRAPMQNPRTCGEHFDGLSAGPSNHTGGLIKELKISSLSGLFFSCGSRLLDPQDTELAFRGRKI
jgi:hypothetical protein